MKTRDLPSWETNLPERIAWRRHLQHIGGLGLCLWLAACGSSTENSQDAPAGSAGANAGRGGSPASAGGSAGRAGAAGSSGAGGRAGQAGDGEGGGAGQAGSGAVGGSAGAGAGAAGQGGSSSADGGLDGGQAGSAGGSPCTDTATDRDNCGACGAVCSNNNMATRTCAEGLCNGTCANGFDDCNGDKLTDGCETSTTVQGNCGACGVTCSGTTCNPGYCNAGTCGTLPAERCATSTCELVGKGCAVADSDGDGLSDAWETSNSGAGSTPPNVPYIDSNCNGQWDTGEPLLAGTSPTVPDIYVTYDWMDWSTPGNNCSVATNCTSLASGHAGESCIGGTCVFSCNVDGDCAARGAGHSAERCMDGVCKHTHDPSIVAPGALDAVVAAFQSRGFALHLIRGAAKPHSLVASFRAPGTLTVGCEGISGGGVGQYAASIYDLKSASPAFPAPYNRAYHYALFAHYSSCDTTAHCLGCPSANNPDGSPKNAPSPGQSGIAEISGNDFIVSLGNRFQDVGQTAGTFSVGSTFMHELGHNLGLHHGGGIDTPCNTNADCTGVACTTTPVGKYCLYASDDNWKPNYLSVMNYRYQFSGIQSASTVGGALPASQRLDYSSQVLPVGGNTPGLLDQSNVAGIPLGDPGLGLNEPAGLGSNTADLFTFTDSLTDIPPTIAATNGPVDWDGDGLTTSTNVEADTKCGVDHTCPEPPEIALPLSNLRGYTDWAPTWTGPESAQFTYEFQCTPFLADGASPPEGITGGELTTAQAQQAGVVDPPLAQPIDIRPGCINNWLELGGSACLHDATVSTVYSSDDSTVPVAILGSPTFDASRINVAAIRFAGAAPVSSSLADVNGDSYLDLTANFLMSALKLAPHAAIATLYGGTQSGQAFVGQDTVQIVQSPQSCVPPPVCSGHSAIDGSTDTNWTANGNAIDPSFTHAACYLACSRNN